MQIYFTHTCHFLLHISMLVFDLKRFRQVKKITQVQAAKFFGCNQSFISDIERGRSKMPEDYIKKLIIHYGNDNVEAHYATPESIWKSSPAVNIEKANVGSVTQGNHNKHEGDIHVASENETHYKSKLAEAYAEIERLKSELSKAKDRIISLQEKLIDKL